jgi:hypothetical protein
MFSINPDAHSIAELGLMRWGLAMARKGGIGPDRVLNASDLRRFSQWLADRRNHTAPPSAKIGASAHPSPVRSGRFAAIRPTRQNGNRHRARSA